MQRNRNGTEHNMQTNRYGWTSLDTTYKQTVMAGHNMQTNR